ncbi:WcaI family glycosyltransferase [Lichenihabitans sp. Uapishka_5]|uniref:WcaI family glycosyltransferase n=1 Tax=Lichenihabitans sp. Uapishka_5 TaxID=3037302 RepID=UPI0029E7E907|nr:WcaI family glycosyltransferase [Lichenihabitans sp. Uapishka_5]MDX7952236.1 WcaI family glycosyltransferase [Lichenihabitans sp. Uapishka_5]
MPFSPRVSRLVATLKTFPQRLRASKASVLIHGMNYAPELIGVAKYTSELARYMADRGHRVEVVAALPHYPASRVAAARPWRLTIGQDSGVRVTRCPLVARPGRIWRLVAPLSFAVLAAPVVIARALLCRPDTVLCVEPTLLAAPAALLAARLVGARTVLHVQDLELEAAVATGHLGWAAPLLWLARAFERAMRRRFDAVVTISDAMADRLRRQRDLGSVSVLRNWVDTERFLSRPAVPGQRTALGVPPNRRLVVYAGNLGAKQGLPVLIEAARHLRADPAIHVLVVGDGVAAAQVRAAAAGLPNLSFAGLLPADGLADLLFAADLHVLPQDRAASDLVFPSKLGPLLMTGKPIVVTADACSELATWLGAAAWRSPPGDGRALAEAIVTGLHQGTNSDPIRAAALGRSLDKEAILPAFERCLMAPGWRRHGLVRARRVVSAGPVLPAGQGAEVLA